MSASYACSEEEGDTYVDGPSFSVDAVLCGDDFRVLTIGSPEYYYDPEDDYY